MSEIYLFRHGQGGATPEAYDQLSALGHQQSRRLGEWLHAHRIPFVASASGSIRRQRETLDGIAAIYAERDSTLPAREVLPALDEYRFAELVRAFAAIEPGHPELALLASRPEDKRQWIGLLRTTLAAWIEGRLDTHVAEAYRAFRDRAHAAAARLEALAEQGPVLAVSSGGVMSVIVQRVLGLPDLSVIDLNLSLKNTGLIHLRRSSRHGWKLESLNSLPHLAAPADRELISLV